MANWNDRRGYRGRGPDEPREDIHQGPWSPYNGRSRDDERDAWGARGRDYWIEDDRWEDRRMGMGDQFRHREDDQERDDRDDNDAQWGNRMGMREEPSDRSIPRSGAWQHEPRYGEMERMWSDRDDHPWPGERRATDDERRQHRDYAHRDDNRAHRDDYARSRDDNREHRDGYLRERGGQQYPAHAHEDWRDEPRSWIDRPDREDERYQQQRTQHEQRLHAGREEQRTLDQERFGHQDPQWLQRGFQREPDDHRDRGMHYRNDRGMHGRDDRDMRAMHGRDDMQRGGMRGRDDRGMHGRDDRDMRAMHGRDDMQHRGMHGRDDRDMRAMHGRDDMQRGGMRGRDDRGMHHRDDRDMRGRDDRGTQHRDDRDMHQRDMRGRDDRGMHHRDDRDMHHRDDRDMQQRDMQQRDDRDMHQRDMQGREHGDGRSGARFGGQRRDRTRYD